MKTAFALLLAVALMGYTAAHNIFPGYHNELSTAIEQMMPNGERYMSEDVQTTNREFMYPESRIQESYLAPTTVFAVPPAAPTISEYNIYTDALRIGQAVEVLYVAPSDGSLSVSLRSSRGDIALTINAEYKSNWEKNTLVFKSKTAQGQWQHEVPSCGCSLWAELVNLQIEIGTDSFIIRANGVEIGKYPYQANLDYSIVRKVKWSYGEVGAVKKAHLKFLGIDFEL